MSKLIPRVRLAYAIVYLLFVYVPISFIFLFSFNDAIYVALPWRGFTFHWYQSLLGTEGLWAALRNSLVIGTTTAILSTSIGTLAAMATARKKFPGRGVFSVAIVAPLAMPVVVIAVSFLSALSLLGINLSTLTVIAGHMMVCTPFAYGVLVSRFEGMNPDLEAASADLGVPPLQTFFRVTLPLAIPGILSALLLSFTISFDEFILSFFLSSNSPTLPVYLFSQLRFPDRLPVVLALASLMIFLSIIMISVALLLRRQVGKQND